jgi:hypothetical protein
VIHHIPQFIAVHHRSAPPLPSSPHDAEEVAAQEQVLERRSSTTTRTPMGQRKRVATTRTSPLQPSLRRPRRSARGSLPTTSKQKPASAAPVRTSPRRKAAAMASAPVATAPVTKATKRKAPAPPTGAPA